MTNGQFRFVRTATLTILAHSIASANASSGCVLASTRLLLQIDFGGRLSWKKQREKPDANEWDLYTMLIRFAHTASRG